MIEHLPIEKALARETDLLAVVAADPSQRHALFWQSDKALVAPRSLGRHPKFEQARAALGDLGWPVAVRATGGDVTPQGPGIVNVSVIYAPEGPPNTDAAYDALCRPIEEALGADASRGWTEGAFCDGAYNIQWQGKKFAGTAQRMKPCKGSDRAAVLAHALMLMETPDAATINALNTFLSVLDQPRRIVRDRHTGLPPALSQDAFLEILATKLRA